MEARELEAGFVALPGTPEDVAAWVALGPEPARVVPAGPRWTLVAPLPEAAAPPPFDHPAALLAGRPLPAALRPAFGFFIVGPRAVLTLQPSGLIGRTRWLSWRPGRGAEALPKLPALTARHLAAAVDDPAQDLQHPLERILAGREGTTERFLTRVAVAVHVPGAPYFGDPGAMRTAEGARLVEPTEEARRRFADVTTQRAEVCAERRSRRDQEEQ